MRGLLTEGLRGVVELYWSEFYAMEQSPDIDNFESIICALVRACRKGDLRAIQAAFDRLDGKVAVEIEPEYPKFYLLFPYATTVADDPAIIELGADGVVKVEDGVMTVPKGDGIIELPGAPIEMDELAWAEDETAVGSVRAMLDKLLKSPKSTVAKILLTADRVQVGNLTGGNPKVKSVIAAGLMKLVHDGKMSAVFEVLEQIDGKVADKVKILGDDVYLTRYDTIAPAGAVKNKDGVYQLVEDNITGTWAAKLAIEGGRR